ncbi:hypothetical protein EAG_16273 [Camponotus floridanus]|uniref:Uncharacterized protein n=1 Tax=Camponotus floridanus TaxID=104421 RepID=E2AGA0_CAMFO|nr:hypothetical protein EAG_16273 [Camponotus floridanus]
MEEGRKEGRKARKTTRQERRSLEGVTAATPQLGPPDASLSRGYRDYNSDLCASGGVTSRIKYLSVTVKAASYTTALAPRLSGGCHSRQEPTDILGSELTATGARRSATSVASSSLYLDKDEFRTVDGGIADNLPVYAGFAKLARRASRTASSPRPVLKTVRHTKWYASGINLSVVCMIGPAHVTRYLFDIDFLVKLIDDEPHPFNYYADNVYSMLVNLRFVFHRYIKDSNRRNSGVLIRYGTSNGKLGRNYHEREKGIGDGSGEIPPGIVSIRLSAFPHATRADEAARTSARLHLRGHCAPRASGAANVGFSSWQHRQLRSYKSSGCPTYVPDNFYLRPLYPSSAQFVRQTLDYSCVRLPKNHVARRHEVIALAIESVCISQRAMSINDFGEDGDRDFADTTLPSFEQISPLATAATIVAIFTMVADRHHVIYSVHRMQWVSGIFLEPCQHRRRERRIARLSEHLPLTALSLPKDPFFLRASLCELVSVSRFRGGLFAVRRFRNVAQSAVVRQIDYVLARSILRGARPSFVPSHMPLTYSSAFRMETIDVTFSNCDMSSTTAQTLALYFYEDSNS